MGNVDWAFTNSVVFVGLVVVFSVLIVLVVLCALLGKVFQSWNKPKEKKANNKPTVATPKASVAPIVQDSIGDDVVAAISAAIAAIMSSEGNTKPFAIRSIKRARESRPAWNFAGINENTRPF